MVSAASGFDLVVRNGALVIPGVGTVTADVGICGSRIAAIGEELAGPAGDVLDARGKVVLPGIFDPHVHIGNELAFDQEAQTRPAPPFSAASPPSGSCCAVSKTRTFYTCRHSGERWTR
jgi:dihydroorotase-like cyclic amidohydrolase